MFKIKKLNEKIKIKYSVSIIYINSLIFSNKHNHLSRQVHYLYRMYKLKDRLIVFHSSQVGLFLLLIWSYLSNIVSLIHIVMNHSTEQDATQLESMKLKEYYHYNSLILLYRKPKVSIMNYIDLFLNQLPEIRSKKHMIHLIWCCHYNI